MKILVIPDIHHKIEVAQRIIDARKDEVDLILHLGDYHDNFGDTPEHARKTGEWMQQRLDAGDVLLLGNHDLPYLYPHPFHKCSGYTDSKFIEFHKIWKPANTVRINFWVYEDDVLYSHAGFGESWYQALQPQQSGSQEQFYEALCKGHWTHKALTSADPHRGGNSIFPGFIWRDWGWGGIQRDWPRNVKQIVGHSPSHSPRKYGSKVWCLDTHLQHYAIVTDGRPKVYKVPKDFFQGARWTRT